MADEVRLRATRDIPGIKARLAEGGYTTRRLKAGDEFYVPAVLGNLLVHKMSRAVFHRAPGEIEPPPARLARRLPQLDHDRDGKAGGAPKQTGGAIAAKRARYKEVVGRKPFNGWDEAELDRRIALATSK
jgi:hypothetical protein